MDLKFRNQLRTGYLVSPRDGRRWAVDPDRRRSRREPGPVCGMRTDETGPLATDDGETYYFFARTCRNAFAENPGNRATESPTGRPAGGAHDRHRALAVPIAQERGTH